MIDRDDNGSEEARRIPGDIEVDGVLRIADDTICEGSLTAPGGVILGQNVLVRGDVRTDGQVEIGPGSRIEGEVLPYREETLDPLTPLHRGSQLTTSASSATADSAPETASQTGDHVRSKTLASTLDVVLTLSLEAGPEPGAGPDALGLTEDALADTLEGAYRLIVDLYRDGEAKRPWAKAEVVDMLCKQVLPLVIPVNVTSRARDAVELRIGRPEPSTHRDEVPEDWTGPVATFVEQMADTVRPRSSLSIQQVGSSVGSAGPEHLILRLHFDEEPD